MSGKLCQFLAAGFGCIVYYVKCLVEINDIAPKLLRVLLVVSLSSGLAYGQDNSAGDENTEQAQAEAEQTASPLSNDIEDLKKAALELNRDLLILEEELLFPSNTQVVVFLSLDVGTYFRLDAVKLHIDDKLVASHLYTPRQNDALSRGGIQRLYIGNLKTGDHEISAFFTGIGPENREYKRAATITIDKDDDPKMLELRIMDSTASMQPDFDFKEWQL